MSIAFPKYRLLGYWEKLNDGGSKYPSLKSCMNAWFE